MKTRKIATFNIRCPWGDDGINSLPHRLGAILDKLDREQPDVVCFQEVIEKTAEFFRRHVPDYFVLYNGRCENYDGVGLMTVTRWSFSRQTSFGSPPHRTSPPPALRSRAIVPV